MFLKRISGQGLEVKDMYTGAVVTVYGRQLKVVDYEDVSTRKKFEAEKARYVKY
jgi:hypothetical protein